MEEHSTNFKNLSFWEFLKNMKFAPTSIVAKLFPPCGDLSFFLRTFWRFRWFVSLLVYLLRGKFPPKQKPRDNLDIRGWIRWRVTKWWILDIIKCWIFMIQMYFSSCKPFLMGRAHIASIFSTPLKHLLCPDLSEFTCFCLYFTPFTQMIFWGSEVRNHHHLGRQMTKKTIYSSNIIHVTWVKLISHKKT